MKFLVLALLLTVSISQAKMLKNQTLKDFSLSCFSTEVRAGQTVLVPGKEVEIKNGVVSVYERLDVMQGLERKKLSKFDIINTYDPEVSTKKSFAIFVSTDFYDIFSGYANSDDYGYHAYIVISKDNSNATNTVNVTLMNGYESYNRTKFKFNCNTLVY